MRQILLNIVNNALKFTDQGEVRINLTCHSSVTARWFEILISDTGIGIPEDKLDSIFDKFRQADASMTRRYGGTGLGLAIARSLLLSMGGTISVSSKLGQGSTFNIEYPVAEELPTQFIPQADDCAYRNSPAGPSAAPANFRVLESV
ncbi:MAG: Autoinducer 2 sensor kinase/phosphatase LuxQ [Phycisphaerae bacterium]|nr:Autoinducer 2 sensor kinase/phosphatase LuxQ [Phycisphaerae bacterium]